MKVVINQNERGFLFKNGIFKQLLEPGKHSIIKMGNNIKVHKTTAQGRVIIDGMTPKMIGDNKSFADCTASIAVPDNHIAMHFVDGRLFDSLEAGEYYYWSIFEVHSFELINISQPDAKNIPAEYFKYIPAKQYTKLEVMHGEIGLLYYDGRFQNTLDSGCYYFWNSNIKVTADKVDLRIRQMDISGQEILTADKVSLRINFVCSYRVTEPVRLMGELKDFAGHIYSVIQLALRRYVGTYRLDELLEQKDSIADFILTKLKERQESLFVEFKDAGLKDIILPGEIRNIMNTVLVAEKTAQSNVISRREEVASTRSLLNTARLLDENETLRKLKEMEYLERICDKVGSISVTNGSGLLAQLKELTGI